MIGIGRCPIIDNLMPVTPATATARAAFGISPMDTIHIGQNPLNYVPPRMQIGHESSIPILSSADKSQPFRPTNRFSANLGQNAKTLVPAVCRHFSVSNLSVTIACLLPSAICFHRHPSVGHPSAQNSPHFRALFDTPSHAVSADFLNNCPSAARKTQLVQQHASFCNLHPAFFTLRFTHACPFQLALPTTPAN